MTGSEFAALPSPLAAIVKTHMDKQNLATPRLLFSRQVLAENMRCIEALLGLAAGDIYFPVKTNDHPDVLRQLYSLGAGFEIASAGELAILQQLGVPAARIIFGNPVKIESHLIAASGYGVPIFAFDTEHELQRIARHAPGSQVYVRIAVSNEGAEWQLAGKFGAPAGAVLPLLAYARRLGLAPIGLSFHAGWNNTSLDTWQDAIAVIERAARQCVAVGLPIRWVNLGGGFPAHRVDPYEQLALIADRLQPALARLRHDLVLEVRAEPGSFLVANAGVVLTRVVAVVERAAANWLFVDASMANGFYWTLGGLRYDLIYPYPAPGPLKQFHITGPTCDSHDVFAYDVPLPESISEGDWLLIYPAGAYITSARTYNGIPYPELTLV